MWTRRTFLAAAGLGVARLAGLKAADEPAAAGRLYAPAEDAVEKGLSYLASAQAADGDLAGAFGHDRWRGNVAVTSLAAVAFMSGGHLPGRGPRGAVVEKALRFVLAQARDTGLLHNAEAATGPPPYAPSYHHGFATLFLAEAHGTVHDLKLADTLSATLRRAVRLILDTQTNEGGWRYQPAMKDEADVSVSVTQAMALRAARNAGIAVPKAAMARCADYLKQCQVLPEGGFRYMPRSGPPAFPRTAAALVGLHCCGVYEGPEVVAARRYLQDYRPGNRLPAAVEPHLLLYGHYYAALALRQSGGAAWNEWYAAIRDELCTDRAERASEAAFPHRRQPDGSWSDRFHGPHYATAMACIILQLPRNALPIFQQ